MASELASARQAEARAGARRGVKARTASSLARTMLCDLERVRAALRAGARPQQVYGIDGCTKRAKQPDTIAHGPDGDVLILVRHGRVTMLGRLWDEERAERAWSRSPRVRRGEPGATAYVKGCE